MRFRQFVVVAVLLIPSMLLAQAQRGTIQGTVGDQTGASVPSAQVSALNVATGVKATAMTTVAGFYSIGGLDPGTYNVTVEKTGFKTVVQNGVILEVSATVGLTFTLDVGQTTQTVTVESEVSQLRTESTEVSTAIAPTAMADLPLQVQSGTNGGRGPINLMYLVPGVSGAPFLTHVNGSQAMATEIQWDGMTTQTGHLLYDTSGLGMPPEAVQEASVATDSYTAEYMTGGGVARFVTRSGTNQFHGNLYEFVRNTDFDARGFYSPTTPIEIQNEPGGSVGGPISIPKVYNGKDRTFFFFNFEVYRLRTRGLAGVSSLPPAAFRNGDFSGLTDSQGNVIPIYDPATTQPDGVGGFTRTQFPGNIIPGDRFSTVSKGVLALLPLPTLSGLTNNFYGSANAPTNIHDFTMKIDHRFNAKHSISAAYTVRDPTTVIPYPLPDPFAGTTIEVLNNHEVRFSYDWVVTPSVLNHLTLAYNRTLNGNHGTDEGPWPQKIGLTGLPAESGWMPNIFMDTYPLTAHPQQSSGEGWQFFWGAKDSISIVRGKQSIKFGFDWSQPHFNGSGNSGTGAFNFSRNETAFPSAAGRADTGMGFASFLLGQVDTGNAIDNDHFAGHCLDNRKSFWVQDDVKLTPNLTLNAGLRWDIFSPMYDPSGEASAMDPTLANPGAGGLLGALVFAGTGAGRSGSVNLPNASRTIFTNFGPRLGIAWKFAPNWVLRTGYGISYFPSGEQLGGGIHYGSAFDAGFTASPTFTSGNQGITPAFAWDNGFPAYQHPPFIDPTFDNGNNVSMWNYNQDRLISYAQNWSFNIQRQFAHNWLVEVGYVGNKGTHLSTDVINVNQVNSSYLKYGSLLNLPITDPAVVAAGFMPPYAGFQGSLAQALRPYPQYLYVSTNDPQEGSSNAANIGNSDYNSMQIKVEKRFSRGLYLLTSFVWAKTLSDTDTNIGGFFSTGARDNYNRKLEKALSPEDISWRSVTAFVYELPFGPGKPVGGNLRGVSARAVGGWQFTAIMDWEAGSPVLASVANTLPLFNDINLPNIAPGVPMKTHWSGKFDPNVDRYLNINAFQAPAPFTYGNAPATLPVREFPSYNENFGVIKHTVLKENLNLEFRVEAFNVFNRTRFGNGFFGPFLGSAIASNASNPINFGQISGQSNTPRQLQMALKLNF